MNQYHDMKEVVVLELKIPDYIQDVLEEAEIGSDPIYAMLYSDLDTDGQYRGTWICLTAKWVYVVTQKHYKSQEEQEQKQKQLATRSKVRPFAKKKQQTVRGVDLDERNNPKQVSLAAKYPITAISKFKSQSFVGSVALIAEIAEKEIIICRASPSRIKEFNRFCKPANTIVKGEELKDEKQEDEEKTKCPKCKRPYPDPKRAVCPRCLDKKSIFKRVLGMTPQYKGPISAMLFLMFTSAVLRLAAPYLSGRILFDEVLVGDGKYAGQIGYIVFLIFITQLVGLLLSIGHGRINAGVTARIVYDLKTSVFASMQMLSLDFYNKRQTGSLMNRVNRDAMHLQYFFHDGVPYFIVNFVTLVGITVIMFAMNWRLTLFALLPVPLIILSVRKLFPHLWRLFSKRFRVDASLNSVINDTLTGVRVVKAFGKEEEEIQRFSNKNKDVFGVNVEVGNLTTTIFPLLSYLMGLGGLIIWGVGGWDVVNGRMTYGTLLTFTGYLMMLYGPLEFMTHIVNWWSSCMNSAQRMFEIIDSQDYLPLPDEPVRLPDMQGNVEAKDVEFSYEEGKPILSEVCFQVKKGEMIGLVGHSGAGKSTMINLIARLYDVNAGSISIDGVDIREIDKDDLNRQIGMVLQDTFLFEGSIFENIAYAKPGAPWEEVIRAARIANAHDFITKLPDGYETVIDRKGHDLSGGERQRLSIARAVLHDPKILILDEATASIDIQTEQLIQEALEKLVEGRTTFAIAHRLSTLRKANRLFVFNKGKISEIGTHAELMEKKGVYHKLYATQRESLKLTGIGG